MPRAKCIDVFWDKNVREIYGGPGGRITTTPTKIVLIVRIENESFTHKIILNDYFCKHNMKSRLSERFVELIRYSMPQKDEYIEVEKHTEAKDNGNGNFSYYKVSQNDLELWHKRAYKLQ